MASESTLAVLKIELAGVTASFRYPHFLIGRQPTYPMPPPSTIYGLLSAAIGSFPKPDSIRFAYHFECEEETIDDLETIWFVEPNTSSRGPSKDFNLDATSNVLPREWLINPLLTLYLAGDNLTKLYNAFREPRYPLVLGRSQDLVSIRSVDKVSLKQKAEGHFDPGLLPGSLSDRFPYGPTVHMPTFIDPDNRWSVDWMWYITLKQSISVGADKKFKPQKEEKFWADPAEGRLLLFHSFI